MTGSIKGTQSGYIHSNREFKNLKPKSYNIYKFMYQIFYLIIPIPWSGFQLEVVRGAMKIEQKIQVEERQYTEGDG